MPDSKKKQVFHVDNIVKIINPEVVIRVGYPLTKHQALEAAEKEYADKIQSFMCSVNAAQPDDPLLNSPEYDPRLYGDLVNAMAGYWLRQKGYGGKERKVYTERDERITQTTWRVLSKRVVKTGIYNHGGYSGGWEGEPDYDPPYLENEQTHILLALEPTTFTLDPLPSRIEVEAANVELYLDPKISMREETVNA